MPDRLRLGVLATHPIQYYSALYRGLASHGDIDLTVYYAHRPTPEEQGIGFGVPFVWDIDLLSGYSSEWLLNTSNPAVKGDFLGYNTPDIGKGIAHRRFDAFLVMGWHALTFWQAIFACWRRQIPVMVRGDSHLEAREAPLKAAMKRVVYPLFVRRFAACLSVGERSDEYFRHFGARSIFRAPHFVDNQHFERQANLLASRRTELRARWTIPADALVALFVGKLLPNKRPRDLLAVLHRLRDRPVYGLFVGDGEDRADCEEIAERNGLHARFAGFINQSRIAEAYAASDVLVVPSERESWGLVVNEAMASGRPAIVSDTVGCAPDLIQCCRTGYVVPFGDLDALTSRVAELEANRAQAAVMGLAARAHVARYSADAAVEGVVHAARQAVGGRP